MASAPYFKSKYERFINNLEWVWSEEVPSSSSLVSDSYIKNDTYKHFALFEIARELRQEEKNGKRQNSKVLMR